MSEAVGRHTNHAFVGSSGSGKTYAALRHRLNRTLTVFVDPTGNEAEGVHLRGGTWPDGGILEWLWGPMADPRRGGHRIWDASSSYRAGNLSEDFAVLSRSMQELGKATRRRSTLIIDEVGDITLSARKAGRKKDLDVLREVVRVSKTGRHTGVSMWVITQRVQELPANVELDYRSIFSVGDAREWRYYEREVGGRQLVNALRATERARAELGQYPYVLLAKAPSLERIEVSHHREVRPPSARELALHLSGWRSGSRSGRAARLATMQRGPGLCVGYTTSPDHRIGLVPQFGGGGQALLSDGEWESPVSDTWRGYGWI